MTSADVSSTAPDVARRADWYAAYMLAREAGSTEDEPAAAANRYMAEVKHVVVPSA